MPPYDHLPKSYNKYSSNALTELKNQPDGIVKQEDRRKDVTTFHISPDVCYLTEPVMRIRMKVWKSV